MDPEASQYLAMDKLYNPNPQNVHFYMFQKTDFQATPAIFMFHILIIITKVKNQLQILKLFQLFRFTLKLLKPFQVVLN